MIKNKIYGVIILMLILTLALSGCGGNDNKVADSTTAKQETTQQATTQQATTQQETTQESTEATTAAQQKTDNESTASEKDAIMARAEKEGVSVEELEETLENLVKLTAYKYGKAPEQIKAEYKADGKTVFEFYATAADAVGMTLEDYLIAEEDAVIKLNDEESTTLSDVGGAEEVKNTGGKTIQVDLSKISLFEPKSIILKELDDPTKGGATYKTSASIEEIKNYYQSILENANGFNLEYDKASKTLIIDAIVNDDVELYISVTFGIVTFRYGGFGVEN